MTSVAMQNDLEAIVDRFTMRQVLEALANIAWEKAEHIQANYDDKPLAQLWRRAGDKIDMTTKHIDI